MYMWYRVYDYQPQNYSAFIEMDGPLLGPDTFDDPSDCCFMYPKAPGDWDCE